MGSHPEASNSRLGINTSPIASISSTVSNLGYYNDPLSLPSITHAYNIVSREVFRKFLSANCDKSTGAFIAKKFFKSKAKNLNLKCGHCGRVGHLIERCFN